MIVYVLLIVFAVASRYIPHLPNFAPITAIAIFAGFYFSTKKAVVLTISVRLISDIIIGFFSWPVMIAVYVAHLLGVFLGSWIKKGNHRWLKALSSSVLASVLFFLITNFAYLYAAYPHNWQGISTSYINGLPFFRATLFSDLVYTVALFGVYEL